MYIIFIPSSSLSLLDLVFISQLPVIGFSYVHRRNHLNALSIKKWPNVKDSADLKRMSQIFVLKTIFFFILSYSL